MLSSLVGWLLVYAALSAEDAASLQVRQWVRQLDAPQATQRDAAEQGLLQMGPAALDILPDTATGLSAEAIHRLTRIRQQLQQRRSAATIQPSTVTLSTTATVPEVLEAIARQTENPLSFPQWSETSRRQMIAVDFHQRPFWSALDEVLQRAGLALETFSGLRVIESGSRSRFREHVQYHGPFRLEPIEIHARRDLRESQSGQLLLTLRVAWEPRLRPIGVQQKLRDLRAVDESGLALQTTSPLATEDLLQGARAVGANPILSFKLPPRSSQRIALLQGKLHFTLPGRVEAFRFPLSGKPQNISKRIGAATVVLESVRQVPLNPAAAELLAQVRRQRLGPQAPPVQPDPAAWQVRMRVRFDRPGTALESHRLWITENAAYLQGADGRRIANFRVEATQQTEDEFGAAYLFDVPGAIEDYVFVYESPTAILEHVLDYQLKDIPLP